MGSGGKKNVVIMQFKKMNQEITLQKITVNDNNIKTYIALEEGVIDKKTYSVITEPKKVIEEIENNECFFIKKGGEIIGSIEYQIKRPEQAYIGGIVVKPDFQGQGIARKALSIILDKLKDMKRIDLVTHPQNIKSLNLYQSLGFIIESRKENYYGDGEPRLVLARVLQ